MFSLELWIIINYVICELESSIQRTNEEFLGNKKIEHYKDPNSVAIYNNVASEIYWTLHSERIVGTNASLIFSHVEYACVVRDQHLQKYILTIQCTHKVALHGCARKWRELTTIIVDELCFPMLYRKCDLNLFLHDLVSYPGTLMMWRRFPPPLTVIIEPQYEVKHVLVCRYTWENGLSTSRVKQLFCPSTC